MTKFNGEMLRLARDLRGLTQTNLASKCSVKQAFISRIEGGDKEPSDDTVQELAGALGFPAEFFYSREHYSGLGLSLVYFRKRSKARESHLRRLQAEVALHRRMLRVLLDGVDTVPTQRGFRFIDINEFGGNADKIAQMVRAEWSVPIGPVGNLIGLIESAGGFVFRFSFGTADIDAISQWPNDMPPLFFLNSDAPMDRIRFSLAHELAHVVMHESATEEMEREADRFAGEFLMPREQIKSQLIDLTIEKASRLKPYWRVSIAALIVRAHQLGLIDKTAYGRHFRRLNYLGYRRQEPYPISDEKPRAVRSLVEQYLAGHEMAITELAGLLGVHQADVVDRLFRLETGEVRLAR